MKSKKVNAVLAEYEDIFKELLVYVHYARRRGCWLYHRRSMARRDSS